jgi:hypothetical protein
VSHWAELNDDNKVIRVLVGDNNEPDEGKSFVESLGNTWVQTSYNATIRGKFAAVGDDYNLQEDIFIAPQPYPSWTRNGSSWVSPIPYPQDDKPYWWDEDLGAWVEAEII